MQDVDFWPEIIEVMKQDGDQQHDLIEFSNDLWPNDLDDSTFADLDDDGWNIYADQTGEDWYSFVENETPPALTIASITRYYDDDKEDRRQELEWPRGARDASLRQTAPSVAIILDQHKKSLTPMYVLKHQEKNNYNMIPPKSSPSSKIRSSLVKLACFTTPPGTKPQDNSKNPITITRSVNGDHVGLLLGEPGPPMRLGAAGHRFPLDDLYESGDDANPQQQQSMHNANTLFRDKGVIVSVQELDHYCGSKTLVNGVITNNYKSTTPTTSEDGNDDDNASFQSSCNSSLEGSTRAASSLAGCTIDAELARALAFRCTPEKLQQERMDSQDYGLVRHCTNKTIPTTVSTGGASIAGKDSHYYGVVQNNSNNNNNNNNNKVSTRATTMDDASIARRVVADRRKWLLAAFKKGKEEDEEKEIEQESDVTNPSNEHNNNETSSDRREWLLEAFKKSKEEDDEKENKQESNITNYHHNRNTTASDITSVTKNGSNNNSNTRASRNKTSMTTTIDKFGGRTKTAVQRRKDQWEKKLAQKKVDGRAMGGKPLKIQTQWKCNDDGSYKKRIVVKAAE